MLKVLRVFMRRRRNAASLPAPESETPSGAAPGEGSTAALIEAGDRLRDARAFAGAARCYAQVVEREPARAAIRVQLGNMLKDAGQLGEAEAQYRRALFDQPDDPDIHVQLGHVFMRQSRRHAALDAYRQAVALDPTCRAALVELSALGDAPAQLRMASLGSSDALLLLSDEVAVMRRRLETMTQLLPDLAAQTALPIALYHRFRERFAVPAPPVAVTAAFTVLLPVDREKLDVLHGQIAALRAQSLTAWRLLAFGSDPARQSLVELAATGDGRICWQTTSPQAAAAERTIALDAAGGDDWLLFLSAGAVLDPEALAWFAAAGTIGADASAFVCDEEAAELVDGRLRTSAPVLRGVVDHDSLLERNVCGETIAVRGPAFRRAAPLLCVDRLTTARSSLLLALAHGGVIGHVPLPLVWRSVAQDTPVADHAAAVRAHVAACRMPVRIAGLGENGQTLAIDWIVDHRADGEAGEAITVIVPTRDNAADAVALVESLLATAARPDRVFCLVIDNGSAAPAAGALDAALGGRAAVRVVRDDAPFNWSALNNRAVATTDTALLLFANDDMRMLTASWDMILRGLLARPDVGAVGARLLYEDDTVQHAGVLTGWRGSVTHDGLHQPSSAPGPAARWHVTHAASAVTGAFLATRRADFLALHGFDATGLPVAYSDVDYACRLRAAGMKVLYTPRIKLLHHESKSRGLDAFHPVKAARNAAERAVLDARWPAAMRSDPSVHPFWRDYGLPFQLIGPPSIEHLTAYIESCAAPAPWKILYVGTPSAE